MSAGTATTIVPIASNTSNTETEEGRKTDGSATANAVVTAPSAVSAGTATTIVNTEVADAATPADDSGKDTGGGDKTKKILQQWRAQGPNIFGPLGVNPTDLAIQNSIVTAEAEEERRQWLDQMGGDLQHMDDKYIVRFNDGHFLKAIKKRYAEKHMGTDEDMLGANNPKVSFQHFTNVIENLLTNTKRSIYKCNTFPLTFCNPFAIGVLSFHIQGTPSKFPRTPPRNETSPSQSDVMTVDQVQRLMSSTTKTKAERTEEVQAEEDAQDLLDRCSTVVTIDMRAAMLPWVREVEWNEGVTRLCRVPVNHNQPKPSLAYEITNNMLNNVAETELAGRNHQKHMGTDYEVLLTWNSKVSLQYSLTICNSFILQM